MCDEVHESSEQSRAGVWFPVAVLLILLVFFLHAGVRPPDVNEAHYLGKAKNYWDPTWCVGDFFFESADVHTVFYWTFGWVTQWVSLSAAAWIGRVVQWTLLAMAWCRLSCVVVPNRWLAVWSAALFVTFYAHCEIAGEWVVGGIESKGFAYCFVLWGWADLLAGRWSRGVLLFGCATAFHPLIGGWSGLAALVLWLLEGRNRPSLSSLLAGAIPGSAVALLGILPALTLQRGVPPEVIDEANMVYVFTRLAHHLALHKIAQAKLWAHFWPAAVLVATTFVVLAVLPRTKTRQRLLHLMCVAIAVAAAGLLIGIVYRDQPAVAARWLRFYWFRLYDFVLPLVAAQAAAMLWMHWRASRPRQATALLAAGLVYAAVHLGTSVMARYPDSYSPAVARRVAPEDWINVCHWVRDNTPAGSLFLTPRKFSTFKWYAERAQAASWKDMPQDPAGIVQWKRRVDDLFPELPELGEFRNRRKRMRGQDAAWFLEKAEKYRANYILLDLRHKIPWEPVYRNDHFGVFAVASAKAPPRPAEPAATDDE